MSNIPFDRKIAIFIADGFETAEALVTADILYRANLPRVIVSIKEPIVTSSHNVKVIADTTIDQVDFDDFDMIVLPGGNPGTKNIKACHTLMDEILHFNGDGRMLAAICAATSVFGELKILDGVRATCNPAVEEGLIMRHAIVTREKVVKSGNIITSRGVGTAVPFALALVEHYKGKEAADALGKAILYYD